MTARTAFTVKKPATTIITTATGRFVWSTLMEAIQPLSARHKCAVRLFLHTALNRGAQIQIGVKRNGRDLPMKSFRDDGNSGVCYITVRWKEPTKSHAYKAASKLGEQESVRDDQRGETWPEDTRRQQGRKEGRNWPQRTEKRDGWKREELLALNN